MTDRANSLTVVLDHEMRTDDLESLISAISQFRNVISVAPNIAHVGDYTAFMQARHEMSERLWKALNGPPPK